MCIVSIADGYIYGPCVQVYRTELHAEETVLEKYIYVKLRFTYTRNEFYLFTAKRVHNVRLVCVGMSFVGT